jgi:hypothetical protein
MPPADDIAEDSGSESSLQGEKHGLHLVARRLPERLEPRLIVWARFMNGFGAEIVRTFELALKPRYGEGSGDNGGCCCQ